MSRLRSPTHAPFADTLGLVSGPELGTRGDGPLAVPRGLKGVVVADTRVGDVRGDEGFYHYRQYSAVELAARRPLTDVWRLMIDGALPTVEREREAFAAEIAPLREIQPAVAAVLPAVAAASGPLEGLRTALSLTGAALGMRPLHDLSPDERRADVLALTAVTPTLVAALHRLRSGQAPVSPRHDLPPAAQYLWMVTGQEPDPAKAAAVETYRITTIDHGFNASTFTARVVASTGADAASCMTAAIGALSGPLHGGAPSRALDLLREIGTPDRIDDVVCPKIELGERIMGFGHAVYRTDDPRSVLLRAVARRLAVSNPDEAGRVAFAEAVEQRVLELLDELKPGRALRTNVEFYAGVVMDLCDLPEEMFTPTFASSRVIGWGANVLEQAADSKIIRPSARYVGPPPPLPVPTL
ncbi:MAG TPA: citrate/2-methylcitrate synthase [Acidimicrobiales bacterium]